MSDHEPLRIFGYPVRFVHRLKAGAIEFGHYTNPEPVHLPSLKREQATITKGPSVTEIHDALARTEHQLPEFIRKRGAEDAKGATFMGHPLHDLSRDDLIAAVTILARQSRDRLDEIARREEIMRGAG